MLESQAFHNLKFERRVSVCNRTQVWLPAASNANTQEAGADVKESVFIQMPATWKMGDSSQSPSPHLRGGRSFCNKGGGNRTKRVREAFEKFFWKKQTKYNQRH